MHHPRKSSVHLAAKHEKFPAKMFVDLTKMKRRRNVFNQMLRFPAKANADLSPTQETLPCRKWGYGGKNVIINDAVVVGAQKTCTYDHLLTAR